MKISVICNHEVALPALHLLAHNNLLTTVALPDTNTELRIHVSELCKQFPVSLHVFSKNTFKQELLDWLKMYEPDAVLLMTSPFIIPESALNKPRFGFVNFHYGLLPQYRGANPVFEQIKNREKFGGVTVHQVEKKIDTGAVILQQKLSISPDDTFASHMNKLGMIGLEACKRLLLMMMSGNPLPRISQNEDCAVYYKRPGKEDVTIDWEIMSAEEIIALINACNPWNRGAATAINGIQICITAARITDCLTSVINIPGTIVVINEFDGLKVACRDGKYLLVEVIYSADGFAPGYKLNNYNVKTGNCFGLLYKEIHENTN